MINIYEGQALVPFVEVPDSYIESIKKSLKKHNFSVQDRVIDAFKQIDRKNFVGQYKKEAFKDRPLPIPCDQTISAPHMYAMMMADEISDLSPDMEILEIGTGSGYGAALLLAYVKTGSVVSIERLPELYKFAKSNFEKSNLDTTNLELIMGDGTNLNLGRKFDRILVTAAGPRIPPSYRDHLKENGKIIMPLEENKDQWLVVVQLDESRRYKVEYKFKVRFVPLIGDHGH